MLVSSCDVPVKRKLEKPHFLPVAYHINGIYLGMRPGDLTSRYGPPLARGRRDYGSLIWRYRHAIIDLDPYIGEDLLRVKEIWGDELTRGEEVLLQKGDTRADIMRVFPEARSFRPDPQDPDHIYARPVLESRYEVKDPCAVELFILTSVPYAERFREDFLYRCELYAVLVNDRITRINARHLYPAGRPRWYINPE